MEPDLGGDLPVVRCGEHNECMCDKHGRQTILLHCNTVKLMYGIDYDIWGFVCLYTCTTWYSISDAEIYRSSISWKWKRMHFRIAPTWESCTWQTATLAYMDIIMASFPSVHQRSKWEFTRSIASWNILQLFQFRATVSTRTLPGWVITLHRRQRQEVPSLDQFGSNDDIIKKLNCGAIKIIYAVLLCSDIWIEICSKSYHLDLLPSVRICTTCKFTL